jgi:hypothetical protein
LTNPPYPSSKAPGDIQLLLIEKAQVFTINPDAGEPLKGKCRQLHSLQRSVAEAFATLLAPSRITTGTPQG